MPITLKNLGAKPPATVTAEDGPTSVKRRFLDSGLGDYNGSLDVTFIGSCDDDCDASKMMVDGDKENEARAQVKYKGEMGIIYIGVKNCMEQRACHTSVFVYDDECPIKHKGNDSVKSGGAVWRRRRGERAAAAFTSNDHLVYQRTLKWSLIVTTNAIRNTLHRWRMQ